MKKCPFCAEEIQDAAIKCRYCGSMLTEATPTPVQVFMPPPHAALDQEIKRLLGAGKKVDAIKLVLDRKPIELVAGLTGAKAYVEAVENGSDPALALRQLAASLAPSTQGRSRVERVFIGVGIFFILLIGVPLIAIIVLDPASSNTPTERQPAALVGQGAPAPKSSSTPSPPESNATAESARRGKAARETIPMFVEQGLIKRMDLATGKFYIDGPLWEGFELDAKQNIVRFISWYREAEYKGLPQVTLHESRSGKELASYGAFSGVTIE